MPILPADALAQLNAEFPGASHASDTGNATLYLALCTGYPGLGTVANDLASQTGYTTHSSVTFTTSGQTASNVAISYTLGTGGTITWIALVDSATLNAGTVHYAIPMVAASGWNVGTATLASPSVITTPAHGLTTGSKIRCFALNSVASGGTNGFNNAFPTGLVQDTVQTVAAGSTTDTFTCTSYNASASGSLMWAVDNTQVVAAGNQISFGTATIVVSQY